MADAGEDRSEVYAIYIISSLALVRSWHPLFVTSLYVLCGASSRLNCAKGIIIVLYSGYRKQNKLRKLGHKWSKWMPELLKSVLHVVFLRNDLYRRPCSRPCSSPPPHTTTTHPPETTLSYADPYGCTAPLQQDPPESGAEWTERCNNKWCGRVCGGHEENAGEARSPLGRIACTTQ